MKGDVSSELRKEALAEIKAMREPLVEEDVVPVRPLSYKHKKRLKEARDTPVKAPVALNKFVASVLVKVLYVARMARLDLLEATCSLACMVTKRDS
eukprot:11212062-Lingulodinium_polyedra.AAC.1